jgi:hypothetical protein
MDFRNSSPFYACFISIDKYHLLCGIEGLDLPYWNFQIYHLETLRPKLILFLLLENRNEHQSLKINLMKVRQVWKWRFIDIRVPFSEQNHKWLSLWSWEYSGVGTICHHRKFILSNTYLRIRFFNLWKEFSLLNLKPIVVV